MLLGLIRLIVASPQYQNSAANSSSSGRRGSLLRPGRAAGGTSAKLEITTTPLEEVKEIIHLPEFDRKASKRNRIEPDSVEIPAKVVEQLHLLVSEIATRYRRNAFHNFEVSIVRVQHIR